MKLVKESLLSIPTFDELYSSAPQEIKELINQCENTPQSKNWHPEAPNAKVPHNVLAHIKIVFNRAIKTGDIDLVIAAFLHDLGKTTTTKDNGRGGFSSHGHEEISTAIAEKHRDWIERIGADSNMVINIVKDHMRIKLMDEMSLKKQEDMKKRPWFNKTNQFADFDDMQTLTDEEKM